MIGAGLENNGNPKERMALESLLCREDRIERFEMDISS